MTLKQHIENLKLSLLSLSPTGIDGFEGLIGVVLGEITGAPFRLAGSGSQFGLDGKASYDEDAICFEGKRYDSKIPRNEILSKIAELSINDDAVDIWVLGATSEVKTQLADNARVLGSKNGISVLILDWSEANLPPFAVALAMGGLQVHDFLKENISDADSCKKAIAALDAIKSTGSFSSHSERITMQCNAPSVGLSLAQQANTAWLNDAFSSKRSAKTKLGQPLSPGATVDGFVRERGELIDKLHPYLSNVSTEDVAFVLGGEGHGKSWIVAQSWLAVNHKPLMLFMSPEDFSESAGQNDVIELFLEKLIRQTGDDLTEANKKRWRRRLAQWKSQPTAGNARIIVVIDGINQRPSTDWARIIENFSDELGKLDGRLVVTSRTSYFRNRVKGRLYINHSEILVPEWTEAERDEILAENSIDPSILHQSVAKSLNNPRLLGIALELLSKTDVSGFEELSVSRLLFEHMRTSERDALLLQPAKDFARRLQRHAHEVMERTKANKTDDLFVFESDVGAVADGRFYREVEDDPTRYSLQEDGLTLALAFAVIDRLSTALRNNRSLDAELAAILEPIEALDDTADVVLAAMTVTVLDEHYDQSITASLVRGFASLQNLNHSEYPAFIGLAKKRPQGFMSAARDLCLEQEHQSNFDWIEAALIEASRVDSAWKTMVDDIHLWLSAYSLSPQLGARCRRGNDSAEKIQEELEKNSKKIEENIQSLTTSEAAILSTLQEESVSFDRLSHLAIELLVGKPLAPFAQSFVNWSFSCSLNSDYPPYKEFWQLTRFNRVDWLETRNALLEISSVLNDDDVSRVGKWTLVTVLRATGDIRDAERAEIIVAELTKDWPHYEGWRLVEDYCATDPCDPFSECPENIDKTAKDFSAVDARKLFKTGLGQSSDDHFFTTASLGLARFRPKDVVRNIEELITEVLTRTNKELRSGLIGIYPYLALLTHEQVSQLVDKWRNFKKDREQSELTESEAWQVSQYLQLLVFPFLNAREQADILISDESDDTIYTDFEKIVKPISGKEFECFLEQVCDEGSERMKYLLLRYATCALPSISENASGYIADLFHSESKRVRMFALKIIAVSDNENLLDVVARSEWKVVDNETEKNEAWYGSIAILKAAKKGLLPHDEALERVSAECYGYAATVLDRAAVCEIARRLSASISHIAKVEIGQIAPDIEIEMVQFSRHGEHGHFVLREQPLSFEESLRQRAEGRDAVAERLRNRFAKFKSNLSLSKANVVIRGFRLREFEAIVSASKGHADHWFELFMSLHERSLSSVHNFILLLANALSDKEPDKAWKLFRLVVDSEPHVRFTFGATGILLDAKATWSGKRTHEMDALRRLRLDKASNDHDLSQEVLAALKSNKHELLKEYIEEKVSKDEPSEVARGLMVTGFSDHSEFNDSILENYEGSAGFIGSAQKAAKYAYERNVWSHHWFQEMCRTENNVDYWRYSELFLKIVDGRFTAWRSEYEQQGEPIRQFGSSCNGAFKRRLERWKTHREKKLFGDDAPDIMFIE